MSEAKLCEVRSEGDVESFIVSRSTVGLRLSLSILPRGQRSKAHANIFGGKQGEDD